MIHKLLIANRGEIAVRIIATCRKKKITSVAVFSEADRGVLHVRLADEALLLGPASPAQSYLNIEAMLNAAKTSGCDAVHPGYGFLAENADFAGAVESAGLIWVGPPADVIALMGDKIAAKGLATRAGVPVVPGYDGSDQSEDAFAREADRIGYPVMLKAAAGGGGRGMRPVTDAGGLVPAIEGARREAMSSFGDSRLFLEKLLVRPRHVEIQVLADNHGNAIFLGERDCSVQRRHQKVLEEAPSPAVNAELRAGMGAAALRLARSGNYVNAGTVEFLLAGDGFYFLEMNTRIQVEHPVTEMVTGLDLIGLQLDVASGDPLPVSQETVQLQGHAIEARLYAEDPENGFLPSVGRLKEFVPPEGPGVRNDVGVQAGDQVSHLYDPLLAKLVVHGETRRQALERLQVALSEYRISGVSTNLGFLRWLAREPHLLAGNVDITFLERTWVPERERSLPTSVLLLASMARLSQEVSTESSDPWKGRQSWRSFGVERRYRCEWGAREWSVILRPEAGRVWTAATEKDVQTASVRQAADGVVELVVDGTLIEGRIEYASSGLEVSVDGEQYRLVDAVPESTHVAGVRAGSGRSALEAPMPGTLVKILVTPGQEVSASEPLVILEAMKMEHVVVAPRAAVVEAVLFREGDMVPGGEPLVRLKSQ
ncbi:MAG TPA: 3-methylcrotonyl-CoA carboxylase [Chloroflexi bacterium]|nr:3-methylcrotonyl-CoA carboxylase [Chloroflexota bacterium]